MGSAGLSAAEGDTGTPGGDRESQGGGQAAVSTKGMEGAPGHQKGSEGSQG